jgi:hypothetical protein
VARSDTERYDQALDYIRKKLSNDLADWIARETGGKKKDKKTLGGAISLSGFGFDKVGTPDQHMALRGLLLCQNVFLDVRALKEELGKNCKKTKDYFKNRSESQIKDAIRCYTRTPLVTLAQFAQTARDISDMSGDFNYYSRTRADAGNWGGTTNCYGAVKVWLFKSGLCSMPWMLRKGSELTAYTCNQIIGDGDIVAEKDIDGIPEGMVFNIHDSVDSAICHWGVCLGHGIAAASNTTAGGMSDSGPIFVKFESGSSPYGVFELLTSVNVCKCIYKSKKVVLKVTDPTQSRAYY